MDDRLQKGYLMEEVLRLYFIRSGHYTVRGVPFVYQGFEVTDIDIWAYDRPSPVSRQRIIVDCKNKSTPKAIERIFWTKGLQNVLGVEQAIVATTDKRLEVAEFGREHGIVIFDGNFLAKLQKSSESLEERLTEEQFLELLATYSPVKPGGDWKARVKAAKIPFAQNLGYSAINRWIDDARFFAEQVQVVSTHEEVACRVLYLLLSFATIALDFSLKDLAFSEASIRLKSINDGLRHGSPGAANTDQVLRLAMGLIEHYVPESRNVAGKVRDRLNKDLDGLSTRMLAEYICKPNVSQDLFNVAKELENAAYKRQFVAPSSLGVASKSLLALFIDYWNMDRNRIFNAFARATEAHTPPQQQQLSQESGAAAEVPVMDNPTLNQPPSANPLKTIEGESQHAQPTLPGINE